MIEFPYYDNDNIKIDDDSYVKNTLAHLISHLIGVVILNVRLVE